jgi:hypothetical protein
MSKFRTLMENALQEVGNSLVKSLNEAGTDYDQVLELCYADWGDWDGEDDSTEPEEPNYICYYLYDAGVGGFTDSADFPEIYHKLETEYIKHPDVLTEDRRHALKFAIFDLSYDDEMNFCQNIADIFNEARYMGRGDWVANFKSV